MKRWWAAVASLVVLFSLLPHGTMAQGAQQERGLFVTPPRQYKTIGPGQETHEEFTVGNANDNPMHVTLSVEQFSVADYTYDYIFQASKNTWIKLGTTQLDLGGKESKKVTYTLNPPANAEPGGHYFSIFASATLSTGKQIRTGSIMYLTVLGDLVHTSEIVHDNLPSVWFGGELPLKFDVKNTGNTHFFIYASSRLTGWWTNQSSAEAAHIVLPQTTRSIEANLSPPLLPGVYAATYGYKTEDGQRQENTKMLVYVPLWSLAIVGGVIWLGILIIRRRKRLARWVRKFY